MLYEPYINFGVGDHIKDELKVRGWTQSDLSIVFNKSKKTISELINNKISITYEWAKLLSNVFGQSPEFWMNLYIAYKTRDEKDFEETKNVKTKSLIYEKLPIAEMQKKKWIPKSDNTRALIKNVSLFIGGKNLDFSEFDCEFNMVKLRKSDLENYQYRNAVTWFMMAKHVTKLFENIGSYNKNRLTELSKKLSEYSYLENGVAKFIKELNNAGVIFFVLSHLQKTYIDGASFLNKNMPVIVFTQRHNRTDNFWFTIAHEIGHVLLHLRDQNDRFVDDISIDNSEDNDDIYEKEANEYARKLLKVKIILKHFHPSKGYIKRKSVLDFSKSIQIHPSIIVGVLQHYKYLPIRNLNDLKVRVSDQIPENYVNKNRISEIHKKVLKFR